MVNGSVSSPAKPSVGMNMLEGWGAAGLTTVQGSGQALFRAGLQYGDGTQRTYVDASANSHELPLLADTSLARRFWKVPPLSNGAEFRIKASATDIVNLTACVLATDTNQKFTIDSASSTSATYNFSGASIIGYSITNNVAGITINNATIKSCNITLNGGSLTGNTIISPLSSPAVITNDPSKITGNTFVSAGTGHAIEITQVGTYNFTGNVFSGYGLDDTNDAAIYNNSGGNVVLNLESGDATPTVKNGVGASTDIEAVVETQSVTISNGLAGTRIQIYDLTADEELYNDIPSSYPHTWTDPLTYVANREIRVRAMWVDEDEAKLFVDTVIGISTNLIPALSYRLTQESDFVYNTNAIDGSTITGIIIDDDNLLINLNLGNATVVKLGSLINLASGTGSIFI
jgi:hypothetical protein